jgi:hypothetical protein
MYNYLLKSGETKDNDSGAIERMVPHLWVIMKNKSAGAKINRLKHAGGDVKKISNSTHEENKEGDYSSNWMLTFHNFKTQVMIKRTCGGTTASAVELDDIPDFDQICENRKAQRKVKQKRKDAILGGKHLAVSELKKEKAKKKARKWALKAKADRNKAAAVMKMTWAVDRSNFLCAIALYDKMGMHDKAREHLELYKTSLAAKDDIQEPTDEEKSDKDESADHDDSSSKANNSRTLKQTTQGE